MDSIYKNLKKIFLLVTMIGSLFNSVYAYRYRDLILNDCNDFCCEQQLGFHSVEDAQNSIIRANKLLGDISEFCNGPTRLEPRHLLRAQEEPLRQKLAEAERYIQEQQGGLWNGVRGLFGTRNNNVQPVTEQQQEGYLRGAKVAAATLGAAGLAGASYAAHKYGLDHRAWDLICQACGSVKHYGGQAFGGAKHYSGQAFDASFNVAKKHFSQAIFAVGCGYLGYKLVRVYVDLLVNRFITDNRDQGTWKGWTAQKAVTIISFLSGALPAWAAHYGLQYLAKKYPQSKVGTVLEALPHVLAVGAALPMVWDAAKVVRESIPGVLATTQTLAHNFAENHPVATQRIGNGAKIAGVAGAGLAALGAGYVADRHFLNGQVANGLSSTAANVAAKFSRARSAEEVQPPQEDGQPVEGVRPQPRKGWRNVMPNALWSRFRGSSSEEVSQADDAVKDENEDLYDDIEIVKVVPEQKVQSSDENAQAEVADGYFRRLANNVSSYLFKPAVSAEVVKEEDDNDDEPLLLKRRNNKTDLLEDDPSEESEDEEYEISQSASTEVKDDPSSEDKEKSTHAEEIAEVWNQHRDRKARHEPKATQKLNEGLKGIRRNVKDVAFGSSPEESAGAKAKGTITQKSIDAWRCPPNGKVRA